MATLTPNSGKQAVTNLGFEVVKSQETVDFSALNSGSGAGAGDTVKALRIPAGAQVFQVSVKQITPSTNTVKVGDTADDDGWLESTTMSVAANSMKHSHAFSAGTGAFPRLGGKLYTSEDWLTLTASAADATAKVAITALYANLE